MNSQKPTVAFWMAVAATVSLLYVASFGPACWVASRALSPSQDVWWSSTVYQPLLWTARRNELHSWLWKYANLWMARNRDPCIGEYGNHRLVVAFRKLDRQLDE